ncbi:hypothetical protein PMO01_15015 [Pseudomonas moraviensis R28-S]|jgi:hypothetical protein|uniref:Uncharacterized protein n=1 Tax=Pseudomonas moraviensis R28-S TaxID=1395516 RepID=V8R945_9PSED|nr:hypothetical protein PMO01_15015 [Pseudomonas moraviensis R28-S]
MNDSATIFIAAKYFDIVVIAIINAESQRVLVSLCNNLQCQ